MSSRLVTNRVSRSVWTSMRPWSSSCPHRRAKAGSSSVDEATFMVASGVRRSWDTAPSSSAATGRPPPALRAHGLFAELGPLQGQGGVVGEGAEQGPVRLRGRSPAWRVSRPAAPRPRGPPPAARPCTPAPSRQADRYPGVGVELAQFLARWLHRPRPRSPAVRRRNQQRHPGYVEHGPDGAHDRLQQLPRPNAPRPAVRRARRAAGSRWPALGLGAGGLELETTWATEQHHDHVDAQGHPVLAARPQACSTAG